MDSEGNPRHWRIRLKHPATTEKWIRPMRLKEGIYEQGQPSYPEGKPVYGLDRLAAQADTPVMLVKGEWCADAGSKSSAVSIFIAYVPHLPSFVSDLYLRNGVCCR